jgi:hypothetical protein
VPPSIVRAGFIDPVYTPAGSIVTESYPKDEPRDLGIWSYWSAVEVDRHKVDFGSPGDTGRIQMESKGPIFQGSLFGGFEARFDFIGIKPFGGLTLLHDTWRVTAYARAASARFFVFDIESEQVAKRALEILQSEGGGVSVRGRASWDKGSRGVVRLTSEGSPDAIHARWLYIGGQEKGKQAGLAILGHPSNVGAPQASTKAGRSGAPIAGFNPVREEKITLPSEFPLRSRYRFVALDGKPDPKLFERLWNDFAFPPTVDVRAAKAIPTKGP